MKLLRAEFSNFRLLRDLVIDFSSDQEKNLTVVRAENETGKTTILTALQWALYGDNALPGKGKDFRLHPLDWDPEDTKRVPITSAVEFEIPRYRRNRETRHKYRIVRSTFEELDGIEWRRGASTVQLFRINETGSEPMNAPDSFIDDELPPELREVFFTDGDRALSFVDAAVSQSAKRDRVQQAIRSLLGLTVLEDAMRHVKKAGQEINKKTHEFGDSTDLQRTGERLSESSKTLEELEQKNEKASRQFNTYDIQVTEMDHKIFEILKKGDKEVLSRDLEKIKREIQQIDRQIENAEKEHSKIFRDRSLVCDLLKSTFKIASEKLDDLHDQGKIPNTTIPVLEDRLAADICICGESLKQEDEGGSRRRVFIEETIQASREADENRKIITELYYASKGLLAATETDESQWLPLYTKIVESRDGLQLLRDEAGKKLRALEAKIDKLEDADIKGLRETRTEYQNQRDRFLRETSTLDTQIAHTKNEIEKLRIDRDRLLKEQKKGARIIADLQVNQDVFNVFQSAYNRITDEELSKVSKLMNDLFIKMIGADPEQGSIIRKAEISNVFDIVVYGPEGKTLNTGTDLNGASRRALTISFILALTKVSEVEAPNVIDTPLGMMSGSVKRSVLRQAVAESSQLVLFLTRSEISGCEDLLDEKAGRIITLTNPAHYPKILINNPGVVERKVLRCECGHRESCKLCDRRIDSDASSDEFGEVI